MKYLTKDKNVVYYSKYNIYACLYLKSTSVNLNTAMNLATSSFFTDIFVTMWLSSAKYFPVMQLTVHFHKTSKQK